MYHPGSKSFPIGIYGYDEPGPAFDYCPLSHGWSYSRECKVSKWDCPVVIHTQSLRLKTLNTSKKSGVQLRYHPSEAPTLPICEEHTEIWFHPKMFQRFNQLKTKWPDLQLGTLVACRTRWRRPEDLWTGGEGANAAPMTCGRVTENSLALGPSLWEISGSGRFRCGNCHEAAKLGRSAAH